MLKKIIIIVLNLTIALTILGCENKPYTKEQEKVFMDEYMALVTIPSEPKLLENKMKKNVDRLSLVESSNVIDGLLYAMYQKIPSLESKAQGLQQVMDIEISKGIDINNPKLTKKISDGTLKAFVKEVLDDHYYFVKNNGRFVIQPNMGYLLDHYEKYMTEALKKMIEFSREEFDIPFWSKEKEKFDLDIIAKRIVDLEANIKNYEDSYYKASFMKSKEYYYQIYFGMNNELMVDSKKVVLKEVLNHYKKTVDKYPETQLSKDLIGFLSKLKITKNRFTDDIQVYLTKITSVETIDVNEKSVSSQSVQEALNKALKKKK